MALTVNSNIASINAQRNLQGSTTAMNKSLERLSSGLRINRAGDDAAGLAISEGLRSQIKGLDQAGRNSNDGLSLIGTAESAMNTYTDILQRIRQLAIQSANDTNSQSNRDALNEESVQLLDELQRIATTVEFNGTKLLDGTFVAKQLQVGAQANQTISITTGNLQTAQMGKVSMETTGAVRVDGSGPLGAGELLINGVDISPTLPDNISEARSTESAISLANAINAKTNLTNVRAEVQPAVYTGNAAGIVTGTINGTTENLVINGVSIFNSSATISANDSNGVLRDAINEKSNQTGVVASLSTDTPPRLVLTAEDGRNIHVNSIGTSGDHFGTSATASDVESYTGGQVQLVSTDNITIGGTDVAFANITAGTYTPRDTTAVSNIAINSVEGANLAIDIVDNALEQISVIRAGLGAITNRLEMTIQNLASISENLSASDSRIRDADFAVETATMTRNQILQQAGISILSQANTTTQSALKLLQG